MVRLGDGSAPLCRLRARRRWSQWQIATDDTAHTITAGALLYESISARAFYAKAQATIAAAANVTLSTGTTVRAIDEDGRRGERDARAGLSHAALRARGSADVAEQPATLTAHHPGRDYRRRDATGDGLCISRNSALGNPLRRNARSRRNAGHCAGWIASSCRWLARRPQDAPDALVRFLAGTPHMGDVARVIAALPLQTFARAATRTLNVQHMRGALVTRVDARRTRDERSPLAFDVMGDSEQQTTRVGFREDVAFENELDATRCRAHGKYAFER